MTDEERRIITGFVERVAGVQAARPAPSPWGGMPATAAPPQPPLPPVDPEADALIAELFHRYPEARYRLTQTAFVTEAALVEAQNRIQDLEWRLQEAQQQAPAHRGGLFGMFGGNAGRQPPMAPRPYPMAPPGGNPAMFQQRGSGFLGTALTTAAGVAGGMMLGNALMGMFSGGAHAATQVADQAGAFGQEAVTGASPWTDPTGLAGNDAAGAYEDTPGGYDSAAQDDGRYDNGDFDAGGGYDENA